MSMARKAALALVDSETGVANVAAPSETVDG